MGIEVNQMSIFTLRLLPNIGVVRFVVKYSREGRPWVFVDLSRYDSGLNIYLNSLLHSMTIFTPYLADFFEIHSLKDQRPLKANNCTFKV